MSADAVPVIWKTGKWNLQPRIVDESIIRHKPEEIGENEYENDRKSCVIYRWYIIRVRRSETAGQQRRAQSLLTFYRSRAALLHNGSTLLLSMDCLTPLLSETKEH